MPNFREICIDAVCGSALGIVKGAFGVSFFTSEEILEVNSLRRLSESVMQKAGPIASEPSVCEGLKQASTAGKEAALKRLVHNLPPGAIEAGVGTAAELVCRKSFKARFTEVLAGACFNLVGCQ